MSKSNEKLSDLEMAEIQKKIKDCTKDLHHAIDPILRKHNVNASVNAMCILLSSLAVINSTSQEDIDRRIDSVCETMKKNRPNYKEVKDVMENR